ARLPGVRGARHLRLPGPEGRALLLPRASGAHLELPRRVGRERGLGRGAVRRPLSPLSLSSVSPPGPVLAPVQGRRGAPPEFRAQRLGAPLAVALGVLLAVEAV